MKVIFVASGNKSVGKVSSFVQSQYDSLHMEGLDMILYPIVGHGVKAHLKAAKALRSIIKNEKPDVVHAHYSICGYVASLAMICIKHKPKLVVSILGSFPTKSKKWRMVKFFVQKVWDKTIVKSQRTARQLKENVEIIPNGVNLDVFTPKDYASARKELGLCSDKKHVIWCSNPERPEKNFVLAQRAVDRIKDEYKAVLLPIYSKTPQEVATYMNAADCLLLTSVQEGSPNVIKEAMACNCPIVTTDVGDVYERLMGLDGCYILPETPMNAEKELAELLIKALTFGQRTAGREKIINDQLTTQQIAKRIIACYE